MDNQEYLNQISATTRPVSQKKGGTLLPKIFKWLVIGAAVIGLFLGGKALIENSLDGPRQQYLALMLRIKNTSDVIATYQPYIRSSDLRATSVSFDSVLSSTRTEITNLFNQTYSDLKTPTKLIDEAAVEKSVLNSSLYSAKINGILDRIYAHKMAYEVSVIMSKEQSLMKTIKNDRLTSILTTSYNSLDNLYNSFNDFSEGN